MGTVDSVYGTVWRLMWGEYRRATLTLLIPSIFLFPLIPPLPFFVFFGLWIYLYLKVEKVFMQQFAEEHGLHYEPTAPVSSVSGRLFSRGHSQRVSNVFSGEFEGRPLRLFNYKYTVGHGKNSSTYEFTVFELSFAHTQFPHILLFAPTMVFRYGSVDRWGSDKDVRVPLESDGSRDFALYTSVGYEIEALQIFTPETMRFLREHARNFSIEFADSKVYLYDDKKILNKSERDTLYTVARQVFSMLGPFLDRLGDDFAALHPYYSKKK